MDLITPETGLFVWSTVIVLIILIQVLALISILKNRFKDNDKLIWTLVVLFLPALGALLYFTIGRSRRLA